MSFNHKKEQVTIFIIVGIVILFFFMLMLYLSSEMKGDELKHQAEEILKRQFDKEAMRIFVNDCIKESLEEGLILLGKQGTFWADDPGGNNQFIENETGVLHNDNKIFYAIGEKKLELSSAYPCNNDSNEPHFCMYSYPNNTIGFGDLRLRHNTLETELENYLRELNSVTLFWCKHINNDIILNNFLKKRLSL